MVYVDCAHVQRELVCVFNDLKIQGLLPDLLAKCLLLGQHANLRKHDIQMKFINIAFVVIFWAIGTSTRYSK